MNQGIVFLCHPYHRGGVTEWMVNAAIEVSSRNINSYFITVTPEPDFISSGGKPKIVTKLSDKKEIQLIAPQAGYEFELGTEEFRALVYRNLILKNIPEGTPVIVSDDSSVWLAAASLADSYPLIGVLHSDDSQYYNLVKRFKDYVTVFIAVSNRIVKTLEKNKFSDAYKIKVIPCGINTKFYQRDQSDNRSLVNIVWVGRIEERQKRITDIPLIALALRKAGIDFIISVLGNGADADLLKGMIQEEGLEDHVQLHGWVNAEVVAQWYKRSDLLLQTSNF